jgi:uncharacterized NAD(P)/FAD-binding protein YdhS
MNLGKNVSTVSIIGGGFCGVMSMVHLAAGADFPLHLTLFNSRYPTGRGIAYNTYSERHLLNVEARNMSAFHSQPSHFADWCRGIKSIGISPDQIPFSYVPRNYYGQYLNEIMENTVKNPPPGVSIDIVEEEVTDLEHEDRIRVITAGGKKIQSDKVILATGNHEPGNPGIPGMSFLESKNYFPNPWSEDAVRGLRKGDTVLIIGTGLTMVDIVLGLEEKKFDGHIIALSPRGFNILPHRKYNPQRSILDELAPPYDLKNLFRLVYKHIRRARLNGESGETVVDAIRSKTQEIWQHLTLDEKKTFMTHIRHLWGVARHRIPGEVHAQIQELIKESKLEVIAGRVKDFSEDDSGITVTIHKRKDQTDAELRVARVINCTGPQSDIRKHDSDLIKNLVRKGTILPDEMNLGVHATADGRIIGADGSISERIFTLGSLLKGKLWESTAVPELRVQAERIASMILQKQKESIVS